MEEATTTTRVLEDGEAQGTKTGEEEVTRVGEGATKVQGSKTNLHRTSRMAEEGLTLTLVAAAVVAVGVVATKGEEEAATPDTKTTLETCQTVTTTTATHLLGWEEETPHQGLQCLWEQERQSTTLLTCR